MKRVIVDYKRLDRTIATKLIDLYPHGYGDDDIIVLKKPNGELIQAVEVRTEETIYLVKISKSLANFISNFDEHMEKGLEQGEVLPNEAVDRTDPAPTAQEKDLDTMS